MTVETAGHTRDGRFNAVMRSGYCFEYTAGPNWSKSPDDDWPIEVHKPDGKEFHCGYRHIDGSRCCVWLCGDGAFRAQVA
jgi:hypothetical protein